MAHPKQQIQAEAERAAPGRVLLVDDNAELRRLLERALTKAGHHVVTAEGGRAAIALAQDGDFDLVISDVRMPDMSGVELLAELHESSPDLPVLLISGTPDLTTAMKAVEYGAVEYLTKPVALDKLRSSAARAIETRRQRLEEQAQLHEYRSGTRRRANNSPAEPRESWTGELLGERYRIGRLLGSGGMGAVYEATREDLGDMRVAVKIIHPELADDPTLLARFRREAKTVGQINHPNIVRLLDFHAEEGEPAFLVMELLDGLSLRQAFSRQFSAERTVFVATQILAALSAVHRARVIHRDIKPENIVLTTISGMGDIVKLLDFGVAKVLSAVPGETLTQTGAVLGTPTYMAPEHARGAPIDARSDLYSVSAVMYEALSGKPPYFGENYNALLFAIQQGETTSLEELRPDLDRGLLEVIGRGMASDPSARYQSAEEMSAALEPWLVSVGVTSSPPESSAAAFAPTMMPPSFQATASEVARHPSKKG